MARLLVLTFVLAAAASASAAPAAKAPRFEGRVCKPPSGHRIADCRVARRGAPDLSRAAWRALRGKEVTIDEEIESLAPSPAAAGARSWPMVDSLAQPMGTIVMAANGRRSVRRLDGTTHRVTGMHMRGHGCAANLDQQRRFMLLQVMAQGGGTQAFVDTAALDQATATGRAALAAFNAQLGGGTECGPPGREISRVRTCPAVGWHDQQRRRVRRQAGLRQRRLLHVQHHGGPRGRDHARDGARRHGGREGRHVRLLRPLERRNADVALLVDPHRRARARAVRLDPDTLPGGGALLYYLSNVVDIETSNSSAIEKLIADAVISSSVGPGAPVIIASGIAIVAGALLAG
jgi:hypothetical protein